MYIVEKIEIVGKMQIVGKNVNNIKKIYSGNNRSWEKKIEILESEKIEMVEKNRDLEKNRY